MNDDLRLEVGGDALQGGEILEHRDMPGERIGAREHGVPGLLERHVVIGRHAIDARYEMTARDQSPGQMEADEAGGFR